jgi:hypothetical protein
MTESKESLQCRSSTSCAFLRWRSMFYVAELILSIFNSVRVRKHYGCVMMQRDCHNCICSVLYSQHVC